MTEIPSNRRFAGQAQLVRLLLWRTGDSTDMDVCLRAARNKNMISEGDETFLRECLDAEERQRAGDRTDFVADADTMTRLQRCADKLNRADSA